MSPPTHPQQSVPQKDRSTATEPSLNSLSLPKVDIGGKLIKPTSTVQTETGALNIEEQAVADKLVKQLSDVTNKPSTELELLSELSPAAQQNVRLHLAKQGWYLSSGSAQEPMPEDLTSQIGALRMHLPGHSFTHFAFLRDTLRAADQENFSVRVVTQFAEEGFREAVVGNFVKMDGLERAEAERIVNDRLVLIPEAKVKFSFAEDTQLRLVSGKEVRIPAAISPDVLERYKAFVRARGVVTDGSSPGYGLEGSNDTAVATNSKWAFGPYQPRETVTQQPMIAISSPPTGRRTNEPLFPLMGGVATFHDESTARAVELTNKLDVRQMQTYFEGGNSLTGRRLNGEPYAVVGRDSALISTLHLIDRKDTSFSEAAVTKRIGELEAQGAFSDPTELTLTAERLKNTGLLAASASPDDTTAAVREFLAKYDITLDRMAEDFSIKRSQLLIVPQPDFHLDMEMQSMAPGEMLLHDYKQDLKLIDDALSNLPEESEERSVLQGMRTEAERQEALKQPIVDSIATKLEEFDIKVHRLGGVLAHSDATSSHRVNFFNGVAGTRPGTNEQFYLTNAADIPSLERAFEQQLHGLGVERVYWMGRARESQRYAINPARDQLTFSNAGFACLVDQEPRDP